MWSSHKNKQPLRGENILVEGDKVFKEFWEEILRLSGANVATVKSIQGNLCLFIICLLYSRFFYSCG